MGFYGRRYLILARERRKKTETETETERYRVFIKLVASRRGGLSLTSKKILRMGVRSIEVAGVAPKEESKAEEKNTAALSLPLPCHKTQRKEWAARLRKILSPPGMLNEDCTIKQDFFKPKKVVIQQDRRWGDAEKEKLLEGLEKYGVGDWKTIVSKLLPKWDENTVRIKTCRLIGIQNLQTYKGWKATADQIGTRAKPLTTKQARV